MWIGLVTAFVPFWTYLYSDEPSPFGMYLLSFGIAIILWGSVAISKAKRLRQTNAWLESPLYNSFYDERNGTLSDKAILIESSGIRTTCDWDVINMISAVEGSFQFELPNATVYFIPKSAFRSEEDFAAVQAHVIGIAKQRVEKLERLRLESRGAQRRIIDGRLKRWSKLIEESG
ncbi:MAG: hypothetical protein U0R49_03525 [Fimbriimonadales bacterium]